MDDDLRDLLDPGDDRVASALQRIRTDLLVGPDEVTAARHRRLRRSLVERPSVRRVAVAVVLAVVGTGAALAAVTPPQVVPGAPAGQDGELHVIDTSSTVWFPASPDDTAPEPRLPTYVDQLPAPPPTPRGSATVDPGTRTEDGARPGAPATAPRSPDPLPGPPADPPRGAPGAPAPGAPRSPATGEAPGRPGDGQPQRPDPARPDGPGTGDTGGPAGGAPAEDAPARDRGADNARDERPAPPPADRDR